MRVSIYPPLDGQRVGLRYSGEVGPLRHPPPNHAVSVLIAPSFKGAVRMAVVYVDPLPVPGRSLRHTLPVLELASVVDGDCISLDCQAPLNFPHYRCMVHSECMRYLCLALLLL